MRPCVHLPDLPHHPLLSSSSLELTRSPSISLGSTQVLDENLFRFNNGYPLLLSEAAKQRLTRALHNDTLFLASINVMDYSLLVGMVQTSSGQGKEGAGSAVPSAGITVSDGRGEEWTLMVRLRSSHTAHSTCHCLCALFTLWTCALCVLQVGLIDYCRQFTWKEEAESRIRRATVIQPKQYKRRFREALHRYFMASMAKYPDALSYSEAS